MDNLAVPGTVALASLVESVSNSSIPAGRYGTSPFVQPAYVPVNNRLPPSSLMSFVEARPNLAGVVISDFNQEYSNKYEEGRGLWWE